LFAGKKPDSRVADKAKAWEPPAATSDLVLRSTFDADPSALLGRFVADGVTAPDDGSVMQTGCSKYITAKEVVAGGTYDLNVLASSSAAASFGIPAVMGVGGSASQSQVLRVKYKLEKKLQYVISDPDAFRKCCNSGPGQCTSRFVSEFVAGDGGLFYSVGKEGAIEAGVIGANAAGQLDAHAGYLWQQATTVDHMYFAFKTAPTPGMEPLLPSGTCGEVTWDDMIPQSTEGKFVIGVSARADSEVDARTLARRNAQTQAVEMCGGTQIDGSETSSTRATTAGGASASTGTTDGNLTVMFGGTSRLLEPKASCTDRADTPGGIGAYVVKQAYFLPGGCPAP